GHDFNVDWPLLHPAESSVLRPSAARESRAGRGFIFGGEGLPLAFQQRDSKQELDLACVDARGFIRQAGRECEEWGKLAVPEKCGLPGHITKNIRRAAGIVRAALESIDFNGHLQEQHITDLNVCVARLRAALEHLRAIRRKIPPQEKLDIALFLRLLREESSGAVQVKDSTSQQKRALKRASRYCARVLGIGIDPALVLFVPPGSWINDIFQFDEAEAGQCIRVSQGERLFHILLVRADLSVPEMVICMIHERLHAELTPGREGLFYPNEMVLYRIIEEAQVEKMSQRASRGQVGSYVPERFFLKNLYLVIKMKSPSTQDPEAVILQYLMTGNSSCLREILGESAWWRMVKLSRMWSMRQQDGDFPVGEYVKPMDYRLPAYRIFLLAAPALTSLADQEDDGLIGQKYQRMKYVMEMANSRCAKLAGLAPGLRDLPDYSGDRYSVYEAQLLAFGTHEMCRDILVADNASALQRVDLSESRYDRDLLATITEETGLTVAAPGRMATDSYAHDTSVLRPVASTERISMLRSSK
ncbi:MAG: hypothetical protein WCG78_07135, partial [Candidatus Omnitrophota bacterium]